MRRSKGAVPYRPWLVEEMRKDRKLAGAYLDAAMEDDDPRVVLSALRTVSEAQGMAKIAEAAGIARRVFTVPCRPKAIPGSQPCSRFSRRRGTDWPSKSEHGRPRRNAFA